MRPRKRSVNRDFSSRWKINIGELKTCFPQMRHCTSCLLVLAGIIIIFFLKKPTNWPPLNLRNFFQKCKILWILKLTMALIRFYVTCVNTSENLLAYVERNIKYIRRTYQETRILNRVTTTGNGSNEIFFLRLPPPLPYHTRRENRKCMTEYDLLWYYSRIDAFQFITISHFAFQLQVVGLCCLTGLGDLRGPMRVVQA